MEALVTRSYLWTSKLWRKHEKWPLKLRIGYIAYDALKEHRWSCESPLPSQPGAGIFLHPSGSLFSIISHENGSLDLHSLIVNIFISLSLGDFIFGCIRFSFLWGPLVRDLLVAILLLYADDGKFVGLPSVQLCWSLCHQPFSLVFGRDMMISSAPVVWLSLGYYWSKAPSRGVAFFSPDDLTWTRYACYPSYNLVDLCDLFSCEGGLFKSHPCGRLT